MWFADEAAPRGVGFVHVSGFSGRPRMPEIVGGGVALADVDGDGDLDLYFVQSGWAHLPQSPDPGGLTPAINQLFINQGGGRFIESDPTGGHADGGYGMGVTTGDYDNDGDVDLYVTNLGTNRLLQNDGSGQFEDVTATAGVGDPGWSTAALFADFDHDGDLDLFVANYLHWSEAVERDCFSRGQPTYCSPTAYDAPTMDRLYRNDGDGTFADVTRHAGLDRGFGNGLGAVVADFNSDGLVDVFVANDRMRDQLWINRGDLVFVDEAARWGVAMDDNGIAKAGMGVSAADVDNDGDTDLLVVNFEGESDSFYINEGGYFVDATARAAIAVASRRHTRFGVVLADFDNDGVLDLYEANGKVDGDPSSTLDSFREPNALFRGAQGPDGILFGAFESGANNNKEGFTSRAVALGDIDNNGAYDLVVVNRDAPAQLLMNTIGADNQWIGFAVKNAHGSPALGARVALRVAGQPRYNTVRVAASYLAALDPRVHFGLASHSRVTDVSVLWPDGSTEQFGDFDAGRTYELRPGEIVSN